MSMSTSIQIVTAPNERWQKMKFAWDACKAAGVEPGRELERFFGDEAPDRQGVIIDLEMPNSNSLRHRCDPSIEHRTDDDREHWDVSIVAIMDRFPNATHIRLRHGW